MNGPRERISAEIADGWLPERAYRYLSEGPFLRAILRLNQLPPLPEELEESSAESELSDDDEVFSGNSFGSEPESVLAEDRVRRDARLRPVVRAPSSC
jgi:hypothetical protein